MKDKKEQAERLARLLTECGGDMQQTAYETEARKAPVRRTVRTALIAVLAAVLAAGLVLGGIFAVRHSGGPGQPSGVPGTEPVSPPSERTYPLFVKDTADPVSYNPPKTAPMMQMMAWPARTVSLQELSAAPVSALGKKLEISEFDQRFLSYISRNTQGNYMVSPLSFRYAAGLLLAGASGNTQTELLRALGVNSVEEWNAYSYLCNGIVQKFAADYAAEAETYPALNVPFRAFRVANSVWKNERIPQVFSESYKNTAAAFYGAEYSSFTKENAVRNINAWAKEKTEGMLDNLLPEDAMAADPALVLMNALYFTDSWETPFSETLQEKAFTAADGHTVTKRFMTSKETYAYYADADTQFVILPMKGGVNMAVVLGDTDGLSEKVSRATVRTVKVTVPQMDFETSFAHQLTDFLKENGASSVFDADKADLGAMWAERPDGNTYVDSIVQKTRIRTDRGGLEAAAVTVIRVPQATGPLPQEDVPEFCADRPFSFYVYTTASDVTALLFAGKMVE